jgi:hypothetical protein
MERWLSAAALATWFEAAKASQKNPALSPYNQKLQLRNEK